MYRLNGGAWETYRYWTSNMDVSLEGPVVIRIVKSLSEFLSCILFETRIGITKSKAIFFL
jgi:hypothetical protein